MGLRWGGVWLCEEIGRRCSLAMKDLVLCMASFLTRRSFCMASRYCKASILSTDLPTLPYQHMPLLSVNKYMKIYLTSHFGAEACSTARRAPAIRSILHV